MMKIIHIESGLGNQMLDYCDLLASRKINYADEHYIETILYDIEKSHEKISMWNGYELENIFGIYEKNIRLLFSDIQWKTIIQDVEKSEFWNKGWDYSAAIANALKRQGLELINLNSKKRLKDNTESKKRSINIKAKEMIRNSSISYPIRKLTVYKKNLKKEYKKVRNMAFHKCEDDVYTGHFLRFMFKNSGIEFIEEEVRNAFVFPKICDKNNIEVLKEIQQSESIAVHVRRGDFLSQNHMFYTNGYFSRAVKFLRKRTEKPFFFVFADKDTVGWAKKNLKVIGLKDTDNIKFIDWNIGKQSFRDMQLMSNCKHNIITNSSFGWWGAFLNENSGKITCSPHPDINTTNWF